MTFSKRTMEAHAEKIFGKKFWAKKSHLAVAHGKP